MSKTVNVQIVSDPKNKVTVAKVVANVWGETPETDIHGAAVGSAKCVSPDVFDEGTGARLALGRALKALGTQLVREAHSEIRDRDRAREASLAASQEAYARKKEYRYKFQCEFAELINAKLEQDQKDLLTQTGEQINRPDNRLNLNGYELVDQTARVEIRTTGTTGSVLRDAVNASKQKPREKAHQIRKDLPA